MRIFTLRRAVAGLFLVLAAMFSMAGQASAAVVDTDPVRIAALLGKSDFGTGAHQWGAPVGSGKVTWDRAADQRIKATLTGNAYMDNLFDGGCARVRAVFYRSASDTVGVPGTSAQVCRTGAWSGDVPSVGVALTWGPTATAHRITVTTQYRVNSNATWQNVASQTVYYGAPD